MFSMDFTNPYETPDCMSSYNMLLQVQTPRQGVTSLSVEI